MDKKTIGIIVGSLRRDSYCKKAARYLSGLLEENFNVRFVDISDLAMYNEDLDNDSDIPGEWERLRREVKPLDAVLFVTPEYNRSMPAVLKNALDVASRPYGANSWSGKPGAIISVSPGSMGAFGANHSLRQTMSFLNIYMMQQPEAYISNVAGAVDAGGVCDEKLQDFLRQFADAYTNWVNRFSN